MKRGFTLIEIIVTLGIISVISVIVFANYRLGEKEYIIKSEAQKLIMNLRRGQNMALAPVIAEGYASGIGLHFNENDNKYIFFLDKNDNQRFEGQDKIQETINLPENIRLKFLTPSSGVDIFFEPPDPTIYINGNKDISASSNITLEYRKGDNIFEKSIIIKATGLIE